MDHIAEYAGLLKDGRVALLTSITGRSSGNEATIDILRRMCNLTALLGPEHGVRGESGEGLPPPSAAGHHVEVAPQLLLFIDHPGELPGGEAVPHRHRAAAHEAAVGVLQDAPLHHAAPQRLATGLPVFSLYSPEGKRLRRHMLDAFDILVYDIQDVGLRFYTFVSTLCNMVEDCAAAGARR